MAHKEPIKESLENEPSKPVKSSGKAISTIDIDGHDLPPSPAPSSPRNGKRYALATELVYTEGTDQYNASSQPIYQVGRKIMALRSTFVFDDPGFRSSDFSCKC